MRILPADSEARGSKASHSSTDGLPNSVTTQRPGEVGVDEVLGVEREGDMTEIWHERGLSMIELQQVMNSRV